MIGLRMILTVTATLLAGGGAALAQGANCPIRILVSGPAGGTPDLIARVAAEKLSTSLRRPVVVENRPGGGAAMTTVQAVKSVEGNGCTLMAANASLFSITPTLYRKPPFDPVADFAPLTVTAASPNVLLVNANLPARSFGEFVKAAKANPGKYLFGSGGVGTPMHLYGELVKTHAGLEATHVPYRGSAAAVLGLLAGEIQFLFEQVPSFIAHARAGTLRPIAVAGSSRSSVLPDVPTLSELGVQGADAESWFGLVAPKGTPKPLLEKYAKIIREGIKEPDVVERLRRVGADPLGLTPSEMAVFLDRQLAAWGPIIKASGVVVD